MRLDNQTSQECVNDSVSEVTMTHVGRKNQKMNYDKQYYILERENNDNHPLLEIAESTSKIEDGYFDDIEILPIVEGINLCLAEPIPEKPELVDYHYMPPDVFSKKVATVLKGMSLFKTQLFETNILYNGVTFSGYQVFHIFNEIQYMDLERSIYKPRTASYAIEKLSLNIDVLSNIEEEQRLVFVLEEKPSKKLYHKKIVNEIMKVNPVGLRFIRIDEWDIGSAFR